MNVPWIVLVFFLTVVRLPAAGQVSDEARTCFEWFSSLGYPDVKEAKWVQVSLGRAGDDASEPLHVATTDGFVIEDADDHFRVLRPDLTRQFFKRNEMKRSDLKWVGFEERSFIDKARQDLEELKNPPKRGYGHFGLRLGPAAAVFFTGYVCWRKGENEIAGELFDAASRLPFDARSTGGNTGSVPGMRQVLEIQLGEAAIWTAMIQFGDNFEDGPGAPLVPRAELLESFHRIVKNYPASPYHDRAIQTVALLERMVVEDQEHPLISDEALSKLPEEQRIAEWIYRLRDQNGHQDMQPGGCDIFDGFRGRDGVSPAHQLLKIGYNAVPQLIEAIGDERFSRSVGYARDFRFSHDVLTIGECAMRILERITGESFQQWTRTSDHMPREEEVAAKQKLPRQWWAKFQQKGGIGSLVDAISSGEKSPRSLLAKLRTVAPDAVESTVLRGAANATKENLIDEFIEPLGALGSPAASGQLLKWLNGNLSLGTRLSAAVQLFNQNHPAALPFVIREWQRFPLTRRDGDSGDFEIMVKLLIASRDDVAMRGLVENWDQRSDSDRFEIVRELGEGMGLKPVPSWNPVIKTRAPSAEADEIAIRLLAHALEDPAARYGSSGSIGDFSYENPRICDFALWSLNCIAPSVYAFSAKAGRRQRDMERFTAANQWSGAHGTKTLPFPPGPGPKLDETDALKITGIEVGPAGKPVGGKLTDRIHGLEGSAFAADTIPGLLRWFATHECPGVRGLHVEAVREADLTGVILVVHIVSGEYPAKDSSWGWHSGGLIGTHPLGNSGGSSSAGSVLDGTFLEDFTEDLSEKLKTQATTPFLVSVGLVGQP
ncbi:MAG: hypothetical protein ABIS50_15435 [Luteolibacter sp.]|uniref:hypothetical protein n=1 Tax=Luteolibacter sp. TaxID=1962973 RepID=UPI0032631F45